MKRIIFLAVVALVAFAGVAYAAGTITGSSIKDSTITGKDVKNKSLTPKDFRGSVRGPRGFEGETGAPGPQGPQGAQGPAGPSAISAISTQRGGTTVAPFDADGGIIYCPAGQKVISGGFTAISADGEVFVSQATSDRSGWMLLLDNLESSVSGELDGEAYCAETGKAVAASPRSRAKSEAQLDRLVAKLKAAQR